MDDAAVQSYFEPQSHGGALKRSHTPISHVLHGEIVSDPATWAWPPTLALEIALQMEKPRDICESYNIDRERWQQISSNPVFVAELTAAMEALRQEGAAFRARAHLQSMELLKTSWTMIHDKSGAIPPSVRADLLKFTIKIAGLDASRDQGILGKGGAAGGLAINIVLG